MYFPHTCMEPDVLNSMYIVHVGTVRVLLRLVHVGTVRVYSVAYMYTVQPGSSAVRSLFKLDHVSHLTGGWRPQVVEV